MVRFLLLKKVVKCLQQRGLRWRWEDVVARGLGGAPDENVVLEAAGGRFVGEERLAVAPQGVGEVSCVDEDRVQRSIREVCRLQERRDRQLGGQWAVSWGLKRVGCLLESEVDWLEEKLLAII